MNLRKLRLSLFKKNSNSSSKNTADKPKASASASATPKKVNELNHEFYRKVAGEITATDPKMVTAIALYALYKDASIFDLEPFVGKTSTNRQDLVTAFYFLDESKCIELMRDLAVNVITKKSDSGFNSSEGEITKTSRYIINATGTDVTGHFVLNKPYLEAHTKSGIQSLLDTATTDDGTTFATWYDTTFKKENTKGSPLNKLFGLKVPEFINTVLSCGFDFSKFVPACINKDLGDASNQVNKLKQ